MRGTSRQTRRKTRDDSAQMELLEEIVDLSPEAGRTTVPSTRAVSTMTMTMTEDEDRGEPAEGIRRQEEEQEPAEGIRQQEKESSPQSFPSYSPKEQRPSRRAREPSPVEDDDYSLDLLLGEVFGTEIDQTPPLAPRKKMVTTTAQLEEDGDADPRDTNQTKEDNQMRGTSRQTRRKTRDDSAQMELLEEIVDLSPEAGRTTVPSTRAVSTMTMTMTEDEDRGEPAEGIRRQEEEQEPAEGIRQQEKESSPQSFPSYSPKEQRPSRRAREPSPVEDDDYSLDLLLGEVFGTEIDQTPPLAPRKKMVTTTAQLEEDGDADPRDTNQTKEDNQMRGTSRQTRRKTRDDSAQMELLEEIVDLSPEAGRTTVPSTRAVSTMTMTMTEDEDRGEPAEGIRRQEEEQEPAEGIRQQEKESSPQSFPSYSPKEQRPSRRAREPSPVEDDDYSLDLLLGEVFGTEIDQTPPLAPRKKMVTTTAQLEEDGDADPRDTNQTKEDNQMRGTSRQTRRKTRDDSAQMELLEEIVDLSPEAGRTTVPSTRAVSTMTMTMTEDEDRGEPAEGIRRQEEEQEPAEGIRQQEKESSPQSFPSYSPKEQRPSRRAREPSPVEDDDYSLDLLLGEVFGTEIDQTPPLAPRKKMVTTTAQASHHHWCLSPSARDLNPDLPHGGEKLSTFAKPLPDSEAIHHKHIINHAISSGTFPPGMMRQVNRLTDFIKPAAPSQETRIKVQNNTTHWMTTNMNILHEHYEHTILTLSNLTYNSTALQIATGWARKRYNTRLRTETLQTAEQIIHTHSNTSTNITSNTASTSQATITYTKPPPISRTRQRIGDSLSPIPELSDEEEFPPLPAPRKTTVLSLGQRTTLAEHITNYNKQQQTRTPLLPTPTQPQRPDQTPPSAHRLPVYKIPPRTQTRTGPIIPRPQPPGQTQLPSLAQLPPNPHFTSPMETKQTPPGPQTSTPQTSRQLRMTDTTNHQRPELSPIKNTTVTSPPNNRKILTQAQIHRPPDQLNTTPDLHSISLTTHSNSNVSILISELISPLCPSPAGGADSGAGATPQRAPPEQKEEGNNVMKGNCKAKHIGIKSHSEPSSQLSSGAPAVSRADPDLSPPTNREVNTTDPQLASPPRQRTLTPILPGKFKPAHHITRPSRKLQDWSFKGRKPVLVLGDSNINHHDCITDPGPSSGAAPDQGSRKGAPRTERSLNSDPGPGPEGHSSHQYRWSGSTAPGSDGSVSSSIPIEFHSR
ncbi:hypothetical protein PAMA_005596 [Pampus argenteus]